VFPDSLVIVATDQGKVAVVEVVGIVEVRLISVSVRVWNPNPAVDTATSVEKVTTNFVELVEGVSNSAEILVNGRNNDDPMEFEFVRTRVLIAVMS
jgi:hypothetical protein